MTQTLLLISAILLPLADAPTDDASATDLKKMQGDWMVASMVVDGMKMPDEEAQALFRTVEGNNYTVSRFSKEVGKGSFTIDATKTPHTIDSTPGAGARQAQPILGIYEFDGATLKIRNAAPGKPRPTTFEAKLLSSRTFIVWQPEEK